jgi:hypothetical protein
MNQRERVATALLKFRYGPDWNLSPEGTRARERELTEADAVIAVVNSEPDWPKTNEPSELDYLPNHKLIQNYAEAVVHGPPDLVQSLFDALDRRLSKTYDPDGLGDRLMNGDTLYIRHDFYADEKQARETAQASLAESRLLKIPFHIGEECHINETSKYFQDWKSTRLWFAGIRIDVRTGNNDVTVAEHWPPRHNGDLTDGFPLSEISAGSAPCLTPLKT